ncbi:hypothetical protein O9G_002889 [Rozella allomycis CSF55]|uniref:Uncharacterized protein n=1 Tax=Rozella allomycis (strain CSF55) TaxID=988480 RepID=A0A075B1G6_ROZAC|nr:hypothetical protein O9G_002889 [Rozella allomycis CSF55]|eukprot:EPZ36388.1 hypothetical protein O9G_002889 [Rozella allomycis CSF55]
MSTLDTLLKIDLELTQCLIAHDKQIQLNSKKFDVLYSSSMELIINNLRTMSIVSIRDRLKELIGVINNFPYVFGLLVFVKENCVDEELRRELQFWSEYVLSLHPSLKEYICS